MPLHLDKANKRKPNCSRKDRQKDVRRGFNDIRLMLSQSHVAQQPKDAPTMLTLDNVIQREYILTYLPGSYLIENFMKPFLMLTDFLFSNAIKKQFKI